MDSVWLYRALGACAFALHDASAWAWYHYALWVGLVMAGMQVLADGVPALGAALGWAHPSRAIASGRLKALEALEGVDVAYIAFNKLVTALFSYHAVRFCWHSPVVVWGGAGVSVWSTAAALVALFVVYDAAYCPFHLALHHASVYKYVHKHHHRQRVPFRGNLDAINVHPFEFVTGEYWHLGSLYIVGSVLRWLLGPGAAAGVHVGVAAFFVLFGGVLASLNHTRFDLAIPAPLPGVATPLWRVDLHAVHHQRFLWNYSQYTPLWDVLLGTYQPFIGYATSEAGAAQPGEDSPAAAADKAGGSASPAAEDPVGKPGKPAARRRTAAH